MTEPFMGQIGLIGFTFAPRGWAFCDGSTLSVHQNAALYALIGARYGGNGQTTFQLPNLCARAPMGQGAGPGLTPRTLGERVGAASVALQSAQMPAHTHQLVARSTPGDRANAGGASLAAGADVVYDGDDGVSSTQLPSALDVAGGGEPHENRQPSLALNFVIALQGIFPTLE